MIKNTGDWDKTQIELLSKKFTLKDAMKFRSNIRFYKQDDIPSKELIKEIIKDAHDLIPHKNNIVECRVKIYGPEFAKEKEDLVLSTMCGPAKEFWSKGGQHEHDYKLLKNIYEDWRPKNATAANNKAYYYRDSKWPEHYFLNFNEQVRAPYLLVYTQRLRLPSKTQRNQKFPEYVYMNLKKSDMMTSWYISAAMHGLGTALLAAEKGITASYCKCFKIDKEHRNPIIAPTYEKGGIKNIAFTLSLGYKDPRGVVDKDRNFMNVNEYVSWAKSI